MAPAFSTRRQGLFFAAFLALTLVMPVLLPRLGFAPREDVYRAVPVAAGPFEEISRELDPERGDLDVLFVGSSLLWNGIDAAYVRDELAKRLGRPARVAVFGTNWPGVDLSYVLLRDFLARRRAHLVVLGMPEPRPTDVDTTTAGARALAGYLGLTHQSSDLPHVQAFRWLRHGEDRSLTEGLSFRNGLALYAAEVLGAPRQLLTRLRPNRTNERRDDAEDLGNRKEELGYYGAPFVRAPIDGPVLPASQMIHTRSQDDVLRVVGPPLGPYQRHFVAATGKVLRAHRTRLVILHVPLASERGRGTVDELMDWSAAFGMPAPVIGVPAGTQFEKTTDQNFYDYYYDEHLNRNGNELFTRTITPALVKIYVEPESP